MRILHVSDLHLGRDLARISRRAEQEKLVGELVEAAREESADLVVIAGDVYDTSNPPAWAEDAFYELLDELAEGGRRAVLVLAGNHDNAVRLAAAEPLGRRLGIWLAGTPSDVPGAFEVAGKARVEPLGPGAAVVRSADGERAVAVGALPFISEVALVKRATGERATSEPEDREAYGTALARLFHDRKALLPAGLPHLLAGHLWVSGGEVSDSERVGSLSDLRVNLLPEADYVALGHLHRPQRVPGTITPVVYPGSPIAYSLSEAGQQKRAVLVELSTGKQAVLRDLPLSSGRPVERWTVQSMDELRAKAKTRGALPIVGLKLDLGRAVTRAELEEIQEIGPAFLGIEDSFAEHAREAIDGTALAPEMRDDELVRAFLSQKLAGEDPELYVRELLELLGTTESGVL